MNRDIAKASMDLFVEDMEEVLEKIKQILSDAKHGREMCMRDEEEPKLKPCPLCGNDDVEVITESGYGHYVRCNKCGARSGMNTWSLTIEQWNRRT